MPNIVVNNIPMDSKKDFFEVIHDYYSKIVDSKFPHKLLEEMCDKITNYYYEQYTRFRAQYPKSVKRYSTFQIKDLDHPHTFEKVINYFKEKTGKNYPDYATKVLEMTIEELKEFEKSRKDFYNMF